MPTMNAPQTTSGESGLPSSIRTLVRSTRRCHRLCAGLVERCRHARHAEDAAAEAIRAELYAIRAADGSKRAAAPHIAAIRRNRDQPGRRARGSTPARAAGIQRSLRRPPGFRSRFRSPSGRTVASESGSTSIAKAMMKLSTSATPNA